MMGGMRGTGLFGASCMKSKNYTFKKKMSMVKKKKKSCPPNNLGEYSKMYSAINNTNYFH